MIESTHQLGTRHRQTVIVVHPLSSDLLAEEPFSVIEVRTVLDAIGLLARASVTSPVAAVLVGPGGTSGFTDARDAVERLSAETQLIGVGPTQAFESRGERNRLDGVLTADDDGLGRSLKAILANPLGNAGCGPDAGTPSAHAPSSEAPTITTEIPGSLGRTPVRPTAADRDAGTTPAPRSDRASGSGAAASERSSATEPAASTPRTPVDAGAHAASSPPTPASPRSAESSPPAEPPASAADAPPPPISFAEAVRARESRHAVASGGDLTRAREPLGDIDLVDAVLAEDGGLAELAIRLIIEQTGWPDLTFQTAGPSSRTGDDADDEPALLGDQSPWRAGGSAPLMEDGRRLGSLHSRVAPADDLERWAEWMARWLELDRRFGVYRDQAVRDELTGAWNRRAFFEFLGSTLDAARDHRRPVSVMVFDIDDFKRFNDEHGHAAGDIILRETVALLESVTRRGDRVCRIGGDEFAVVFVEHDEDRGRGAGLPDDVGLIARRFQEQVHRMRFPRLGVDAPGTVSVSAGLSSFPWDGSAPDDLLRIADERALASKRRGKNHITYGPHAVGPDDAHPGGADDPEDRRSGPAGG